MFAIVYVALIELFTRCIQKPTLGSPKVVYIYNFYCRKDFFFLENKNFDNQSRLGEPWLPWIRPYYSFEIVPKNKVGEVTCSEKMKVRNRFKIINILSILTMNSFKIILKNF